ncbi:glyoxalase [Litorihabitans aurantiacus]|uniref:VOC domain-containing protein n=1 Tax=Litorihabitans aurantiacus TaxID=1930061 RepID=A0AA38CVH8_9MICO|nr:glyoxalase [Litorihabitans aurantiacus]GMA32980.1 hypothetical protein GCM10025875_29720 [Litorihabitans aurantiacus]
MGVRSFEHVGVVVEDLDAAADFFVLLGFERGEKAEVRGEWVDRVTGLRGVELEMIVLTAPDGSGAMELTRFRRPASPGLTIRHRRTPRVCATSPTGWTDWSTS